MSNNQRPGTPEESFYLRLVKGDELRDVKPPMNGEVLYEMPSVAGTILILQEPSDGRTPAMRRRVCMVRDTPTADGVVRKLLTPLVTVDDIMTIAEQVMVGNGRVVTWSFTSRVLAMGGLLGLSEPMIAAAAMDGQPGGHDEPGGQARELAAGT